MWPYKTDHPVTVCALFLNFDRIVVLYRLQNMRFLCGSHNNEKTKSAGQNTPKTSARIGMQTIKECTVFK